MQTMETVAYGAFSDSFHSRPGGRGRRGNGPMKVPRRCPLTCLHCYNNLPMTDGVAARRELDYAEHCRILDELADAGCLWLLYTGGEILARRDFLDIYTHAKRNGFLITLFTNGTLVTRRVADYLAEYRPFSIEITLYGRTQATYERLTGIPGSHAKCLRGIELLLERGLPLSLKTVAVTVNRHEIAEMQRFARSLGVPFKFDAMMNPRLDCSQSPLAVRLTPEETVSLDLDDDVRSDGWKAFTRRTSQLQATAAGAPEIYQCGGGVTSFAIDPYGRMSICVLSERDKYDLRTGTVREGWSQFLRAVRHKRATRLTKCSACALKSMCGMCPANGELENGDPEAPVDFLCRVAHVRAYALDLPVAPHGDCEYCAGGSGYDEISRAAASLRESRPGEAVAAGRNHIRLLPIADGTARAGGCSTCSACAHQ